jgi:cytochrome c oxidase cbb3-type subunit 3
MKNFIKNISAKGTAKNAVLAMLLMIGLPAFAQDGSGVSDTTLLYILVSMIVIQLLLVFVVAGVIKTIVGSPQIFKRIMPSADKAAAVLGALLLVSTGAFAQDGGADKFVLDAELELLLICVNAFLLVIIVALLYNVKTLLKIAKGPEEAVAEEEQEDVFASLGLTDAVPIENESEILMDHSYDGIHELDNNLPPWWKYGFYITVVLMVGYMWYYLISVDHHVGHNEFVAEMAQAAEEAAMRKANVDENSVELLTAAADLTAGKKIFTQNCVVCHGANGEGGVGPNLTDEYWIHGGGIKNVFRTVKVGVPEKGMTPWGNTLSPTDMQKVSSYVLSLQGTTPPNGKEPQGEVWSE